MEGDNGGDAAADVSCQLGDSFPSQRKTPGQLASMGPVVSPQKRASSSTSPFKNILKKSPRLTQVKNQKLNPFKSMKRLFSPAKRTGSTTCPLKHHKSSEISSEDINVKSDRGQPNLHDENVVVQDDDGESKSKKMKPVTPQALTNEQVLKMFKDVLESDPHDAPGQSGAKKIDVAASRFDYLPTMTRARVREFLEKISMPSPVKAARDGPSIMDVEFNEEDDDDEYNPEKDEECPESDDESVTSSKLSEFGSPFRDFTSNSFIMTPSGDRTSAEKSKVIKEIASDAVAESDVPTIGNTSVENVLTIDTGFTGEEHSDGIALRTRSKQPLTSTSITEIESNFVAPDITTDMYDNYCDNPDYAQFLSSLQKPADDAMTDDETDANDPEFNYISEAAKEPLDYEDFRFDKITHISKKEVATLVVELNKIYKHETLPYQAVLNASEMTGSWKLLPGGRDMPSSSEDEDARVVLPIPTTSSLKYTGVSQPESSAASTPLSEFKTPLGPPTLGLPPPTSSLNLAHITSNNYECSQPGNSLTIPDKNSVSNTDTNTIVTPEQRALIEDNIRKHIQLLLQSCLLCQNCSSLASEASESKSMIIELSFLRQTSCFGGTSIFDVCNLDPAVEMVSTPTAAENIQLLNHKEGEPIWTLSKAQKLAILNSPAFVYPHLLPPLTKPKVNERKYIRFSRSEDNLIAIGLEQFQKCKGVNSYQLIHQLLIRGKDYNKVKFRIQFMSSCRSSDNVIQTVKQTGKLPDSIPKPSIDYFYPVAPKDQMPHLLPAWCSSQLHKKQEPEAKINLPPPTCTDQLPQEEMNYLSTHSPHKETNQTQQTSPSQFQRPLSISAATQPLTFQTIPAMQLPAGLPPIAGIYIQFADGAGAGAQLSPAISLASLLPNVSAICQPRTKGTRSNRQKSAKRKIIKPSSSPGIKKQRIQVSSAEEMAAVGDSIPSHQSSSPDLLSKTLLSCGLQEYQACPSPRSQFQCTDGLNQPCMSFTSSTPIAQDKHPTVRNLAWEFDAAHRQSLPSPPVTETQNIEKAYRTQTKSPYREVSTCQSVVSGNGTAVAPDPRSCLPSPLHHSEPDLNGEPLRDDARISKSSLTNLVPNQDVMYDISKHKTGNDFHHDNNYGTSQSLFSSDLSVASDMVNMVTEKQTSVIVDKISRELPVEGHKFSELSSRSRLLTDITFQPQTELMDLVDSGLTSDCTKQKDNAVFHSVQGNQSAESVSKQNNNAVCETVQGDQSASKQNDYAVFNSVQGDQSTESASKQNDNAVCETVQGDQSTSKQNDYAVFNSVQEDQSAESASKQNENAVCETVQGDQTAESASKQNDNAVIHSVQGEQPTESASKQNDNAVFNSVQGDQSAESASKQNDNAVFPCVQGDQSAESAGKQNDNAVFPCVQGDQSAESAGKQNDNAVCETVQGDQSVNNLSIQNDSINNVTETYKTVQDDRPAESEMNLPVNDDEEDVMESSDATLTEDVILPMLTDDSSSSIDRTPTCIPDSISDSTGSDKLNNRELNWDNSELKSGSDELKSDKGELKSDKGELKSDTGELKSDTREKKSDKGDYKSGKSEHKSDNFDWKSDKSEKKSDKGDFKSEKGEKGLDKGHLKSDKSEKSDEGDLKSDKSKQKSDYREVKSDKGHLKSDKSDKKSDNGDLRSDKSKQKSDNSEHKSDKGDLKSDNIKQKSDYREVKSDKGHLNSDKSDKKSDKGDLRSDKGKQKSDNSEHKSDKGDLKSDNSKQKSDNSELRSDKSDLRSDKREQKSDKSDLRSDRSKQRSDKSDLKSDKSEPKSDKGDLKSDRSKQRSDKSDLRSDKSKQRSDKNDLRSDKSKQRSDKGDLKSDKSKQKSDNSELRSDKSDLRSDKSEKKSEKGDLMSDNTKQRSHKGELRSDKGKLKSDKSDQRSSKAELRLDKGKQGSDKSELRSDKDEQQKAQHKPKTIRQILEASERSKLHTVSSASVLNSDGRLVTSDIGSQNTDTAVKAGEDTKGNQLVQDITLTNDNRESSPDARQEDTSPSSGGFSVTPALKAALISLQSPVKSSSSSNFKHPSSFKTPTKLQPLLPKMPSSAASASSPYVPLPKSSPKRKELNKHVRQILPKSFVFEMKSPSPTKTAAEALKKKATLFCQSRSPVKLLPKQPQMDLSGPPGSRLPLTPTRMTTRSQKIKVKNSGKKSSKETAPPVAKDPQPVKEKVIVEPAAMEVDDAVLSQEEEEEDFESDDQSQLDDLMAACTTIGYDPKKGISGTDNDHKSKAQKKKDVCLSMLEPDIIDRDAKKDERDTAYAQHYFTRIKQVLSDDAERFKKFLTILHDMNRNHMSPVELYADMATLLSGHQDLVDDFAGFLLSFQAVECHCFVSCAEYEQILTFLRRLEIYCDSSNLTYQRTLKMMSRWLTMLNQEAQNATTFKEKIAALFRHVPNIMDDLQSYFFGTPLPDSHPDDFEEVDLEGEAVGDVDEFEEITLPEAREDYNTKLCSCQCHQDQQDEKLRRRIKHCYSCSLKIFDGKPVLKTSRNEYRPITVLYPLEEKEKMIRAKKEAAQLALAKARAQRQRKKRKGKKKNVGSLKSKNSKNIPLKKKFRKKKRCKMQINSADAGDTGIPVADTECKSSQVQDSGSIQKQERSDLKSTYSMPSDDQQKTSSVKLTENPADGSGSPSASKTSIDAENSSTQLASKDTAEVSHAPTEATLFSVVESKLDINSAASSKESVDKISVNNVEPYLNDQLLSFRLAPSATPHMSATPFSSPSESRPPSVISLASTVSHDHCLAASDFEKSKVLVINKQHPQMTTQELNISPAPILSSHTRSVSCTSSVTAVPHINSISTPRMPFSQISSDRPNVNMTGTRLNNTVVSSQNTTFVSFSLQPRFFHSPMIASPRIPVLVTIAPQQFLPPANSVVGNEMNKQRQMNPQVADVMTTSGMSSRNSVQKADVITSSVFSSRNSAQKADVMTTSVLSSRNSVQKANVITSSVFSSRNSAQKADVITSSVFSPRNSAQKADVITSSVLSSRNSSQKANVITTSVLSSRNSSQKADVINTSVFSPRSSAQKANVVPSSVFSSCNSSQKANVITTSVFSSRNSTQKADVITTSEFSPHQSVSEKLGNRSIKTDPSHNVNYSHPVGTKTLSSVSSSSSVPVNTCSISQTHGAPASTVSDSRIDALATSSNSFISFSNMSSSFMHSDKQSASVSSGDRLDPVADLQPSDTTHSLPSTPVKEKISAAVLRAHLDNFSLGAFDTSMGFSQLQQFTQSPSKYLTDSMSKFDLLALIESSNLGNKDISLQSCLASSSSKTQTEPLLTFSGALEKLKARPDKLELTASGTVDKPQHVSVPVTMENLLGRSGSTGPHGQSSFDYEMGDDQQILSMKETEEDLSQKLNTSQMLLDDESSNLFVLSVWTEEQDRLILDKALAEGVTQETIKKLHAEIPEKSFEEINSRARLLLQMLEQMGDTESDTDTDTSRC